MGILTTPSPTIIADIVSAILQRVLSASVTVDKQLVSSIGKGVLVFAAVAPGDTEKDVETLAAKVLKMRLVRSRIVAFDSWDWFPSMPSFIYLWCCITALVLFLIQELR